MTIQKPDFNQIFASQAPDVDKPTVFNNYNGGMGDEYRPNNGKPTIKGFNFIQNLNDNKFLWMVQNGAFPYDSNTEYNVGIVTLKDGRFKQWDGASWINFGQDDNALKKASNLSDLQSSKISRTNLDVYSKEEVDAKKATESEAIAGTNDSNFVTPLALSSAIKALTINSKMSQRNVTSQRLLNTTYTNPSESMKIVLVGFRLPQGANVDVRVDNEIQGFATNFISQSVDNYRSIVAFVNPLQTYRFNVVVGSPAIQFCTEISL